jgi:hypothetical protein
VVAAFYFRSRLYVLMFVVLFHVVSAAALHLTQMETFDILWRYPERLGLYGCTARRVARCVPTLPITMGVTCTTVAP